jgi:hypothetical protein
VDIGMVSGDPEVRRLHRRFWADGDLLQLVGDLKLAGIGVGLVIPIEAGGFELAERHLSATRTLCTALPLSEGDLVYLVDMRELVGPETEAAIRSLSMTPLDELKRKTQTRALREGLAPLRARKVKVVPYSLEKQ